tara:strand:- start:394 stop:2259 length:1866 start_codon:yes stop_codon:yes gene_type:complete
MAKQVKAISICRVYLWCILLLIGMVNTGFGQTYQMDTIYVSASRLPSSQGTNRLVAVLDSAEIARIGAHSIAELLNAIPGIHSRTRGPIGVQTDLEMAGATYSQVMVMVDGMRVNDPQTGHHTLNLPLRPQDLQRVEIVYGAGSAVHGPDAFGGVVNLVPHTVPQRHVALSSLWGKAKTNSDVAAVAQRATVRYNWKREWGDISFSVGKERSDGYRDTTEFDIDHLLTRLRLPLLSGELKLIGGVEDKAFGAKDFYAPYPSKEWTRIWLGNAQYQRRLRSNKLLNSRMSYRRHRDRFVLWRDNPSAYENRHINESMTLETHLIQPWREGQILWGGELSYLQIDSNNLGEHAQRRGALFAESSHPIDEWLVKTSARVDYSNTYDMEFSPSVSLARKLQTGRLSLGLGRAFRAPSFTEQNYNKHVPRSELRRGQNIGNPSLNAERAWTYEAVIATTLQSHLHLQGHAYARYENNLIDYIKNVRSDTLFEAKNLGKIRTVGTLIDLSYHRWNAFSPSFSYAWNNKTRRLAEGLESKYVFTQPRQQISIHLTHHLPAGMHARWHYDFRQYTTEKDYGVSCLTISRSMPYGQVRLRIDNLTDIQYEEIPGVPMPGRWFTVETVSNL